MIIQAVTIKLYAPWVQTLKEKRMVTKSITAKLRNKFNISVAEVDQQELHKTIVLGIACVAGTTAQSDSIIDKVISFIEMNTEAEIQDIKREIR